MNILKLNIVDSVGRPVGSLQTHGVLLKSNGSRRILSHNARFINIPKYFIASLCISKKNRAFIDSNISPRLGTRRAVNIFFT